jgi:hypothetical protein
LGVDIGRRKAAYRPMKLGDDAEIVSTKDGKVSVEFVRDRWRIYEVIESGGFMSKGRALRQDNKPLAFWMKQDAKKYVDRWLR